MNRTILIAEDDQDIVELLRLYLENEGYQVVTAGDGRAAYQLMEQQTVDLALVDIMMPQMNGYELIRAIREKHNIPVIILSAKAEDSDKIIGLKIGADDYVTKPFNPLEIVARVQAGLRRYYELGSEARTAGAILKVGQLRLDLEQICLTKDDQTISLTPTEFRILSKLMRQPGRVFTKAQLYDNESGLMIESDDNTMMVHISRLRDKIEDDPKNPRYIITVRGLGYKIEKA